MAKVVTSADDLEVERLCEVVIRKDGKLVQAWLFSFGGRWENHVAVFDAMRDVKFVEGENLIDEVEFGQKPSIEIPPAYHASVCETLDGVVNDYELKHAYDLEKAERLLSMLWREGYGYNRYPGFACHQCKHVRKVYDIYAPALNQLLKKKGKLDCSSVGMKCKSDSPTRWLKLIVPPAAPPIKKQQAEDDSIGSSG